MDIVSSTAGTVVLVAPIALGLTELVKQTDRIPDEVKPVIAILIAIGVAFLVATDLSTRATIVAGLIAGLTSAGLYSGTKAIAGK